MQNSFVKKSSQSCLVVTILQNSVHLGWWHIKYEPASYDSEPLTLLVLLTFCTTIFPISKDNSYKPESTWFSFKINFWSDLMIAWLGVGLINVFTNAFITRSFKSLVLFGNIHYTNIRMWYFNKYYSSFGGNFTTSWGFSKIKPLYIKSSWFS